MWARAQTLPPRCEGSGSKTSKLVAWCSQEIMPGEMPILN